MKFKILNDDMAGRFKSGEIGERQEDASDNWNGKYHCSLYLGDVMAPALFSKDPTPVKHRRVFCFYFWEVEPIISDRADVFAQWIEESLRTPDRVEALRNRGHLENVMDELDIDEEIRDEVAEAVFRRII